MGGRFHEASYPPLSVVDFGTSSLYRVAVHHGGRTIVIGDHTDVAFQTVHTMVQPGAETDVVIHGLPGRFIERFAGCREIPAPVVAELLRSAGIVPGTPLRLLTCHAAEPPLHGNTAAEALVAQWGGPVTAANGLLRIGTGPMRIDLVDWDPDPILGGMSPQVIGQGQGTWVLHTP